MNPFDEWFEKALTSGVVQRVNRSTLEAAFDAGVFFAEWVENPVNELKPEWLGGRHWEYEQ